MVRKSVRPGAGSRRSGLHVCAPRMAPSRLATHGKPERLRSAPRSKSAMACNSHRTAALGPSTVTGSCYPLLVQLLIQDNGPGASVESRWTLLRCKILYHTTSFDVVEDVCADVASVADLIAHPAAVPTQGVVLDWLGFCPQWSLVGVTSAAAATEITERLAKSLSGKLRAADSRLVDHMPVTPGTGAVMRWADWDAPSLGDSSGIAIAMAKWVCRSGRVANCAEVPWIESDDHRRLASELLSSPFFSSPRPRLQKGCRAVSFRIEDHADVAAGVAISHHALLATPDLLADHGVVPVPADDLNESTIVELRLHRDPGDSLLYESNMNAEHINPTQSYREWIHREDGEIVVLLLAGVHGCHMRDLEELEALGAPADVAPRCFFHCLSGHGVKPSPVHAAVPTLCLRALRLSEISAVQKAMHIVQRLDQPVPRPELCSDVIPCKWCHRRRSSNKRCSGCRAVAYCCVDHQRLDWKEGKHSKACKRLGRQSDVIREMAAPEIDCIESDAASLVHHAAGLRDTLHRKVTALVVALPRATAIQVERFISGLARVSAADILSRIVVCSADISESNDNCVWAISATSSGIPPKRQESTGVLGDIWHLEGRPQDESVCLVRLCAAKVHHVAERPNGLPPHVDLYFSVSSNRVEGISFFEIHPSFVLRALTEEATDASAQRRAVFTFETEAATNYARRILRQQASCLESSQEPRALKLVDDARMQQAPSTIVGAGHDRSTDEALNGYANLFSITLQ